ncbi:MAG TPA: flippase [Terriglobales bacterium]|jgi:O-antigen/teichoic acid export membrane protein
MSAAPNLAPCDTAVSTTLPATDASEFRSRMGSISRQSLVYCAGTLLTAAAGYFFKIYLARELGAEALGLYALGMTIVGFLGVFNALGLPTAATRFVAAYSARKDHWRLASFLRSSLALLCVVNVAFAALILIAGPWIADRFYHAPKLSPYLWAFAAIMMLGVLNMFLCQVMAGFRDVARRTFITHFIGTPANIVIAVILISLGFALTGYLVAQVLSAILVLCLLGRLVWKITPSAPLSANKRLHLDREVISFSVAAYGIAGLQYLLAQADTIVLGHFLVASQVGIYAVAMAMVAFISIALTSVNQIFSPIISELHTANNLLVLQQLYSTLTKWVLALTFPLALTMIVFSAELMAIFGSDFRSGAGILVIGAVGQFFNCAVGSVGYLLLMSGNQNELIKIQAANAGVLLLLNLLLVPRWGILGAAIATSLTTVCTNLWSLLSVRRILRLSPYNSGYLKLIMPAAGCACSLVILAAIARSFSDWEIAGAAFVTSYLSFAAILLLLGLDPSDRMLAKLAWTRVGQGFKKMAIA